MPITLSNINNTGNFTGVNTAGRGNFTMSIASTTPSIVTNGLIVNLDAGNPTSYPGSGSIWTDLSTNGYVGTLINSPTFSSANGGSLIFNGTNNGVSTNANMASVQSFTATSWIKTTNSAGYNFVFSNGSYPSPIIRGWGLVLDGNNINFDHCYITTVITYSYPSVYDGTWRQIGIYRDSSNSVGITINGVVVTSGSYSSAFTNSTLSVGYRPGGYSSYFGGNIGNMMVYDRGLTTDELLQNYNATKTRFGL